MVGRHRHSQIRIVILLPTCTKNWCRLLGQTWLYPCKAYTITRLKHEQSQICPHSNLTKYSATAWDVTYPRNNFTNWAAELWAATTPVGLSSGPSPMDRVRKCDNVKKEMPVITPCLQNQTRKQKFTHLVSNFLSRHQA